MVMWVVTIIIFTTTTAHWTQKRAGALTTYAPTLAIAWLLVIATLIASRFWDYWITVLPGG